jgi:hypothetical protein
MVTDNIIYGNVAAFDRNARMTEAEYNAELTPILVWRLIEVQSSLILLRQDDSDSIRT